MTIQYKSCFSWSFLHFVLFTGVQAVHAVGAGGLAMFFPISMNDSWIQDDIFFWFDLEIHKIERKKIVQLFDCIMKSPCCRPLPQITEWNLYLMAYNVTLQHFPDVFIENLKGRPHTAFPHKTQQMISSLAAKTYGAQKRTPAHSPCSVFLHVGVYTTVCWREGEMAASHGELTDQATPLPPAPWAALRPALGWEPVAA